MMKFIFLDRDGVINKDPGGSLYVTSWEDFHFLPGSLEALKSLKKKGYLVAVVSNQAGVGKGIYTREILSKITENMIRAVEAAGGELYSVQYCTHTSEDNCDCRKPKAGLFKTAAKGLNIDFSKIYFIGDTKRDIEAGRAIGCKTILVLSGKIKSGQEVEGWEIKPDIIKRDLFEAVEEIHSRDSLPGGRSKLSP
ncbi:MAG: D-glycero-beta-D-manno-heptose 1,7-bisphosphate 7-phosphatase [Candidatus Omnitrophica bacterium]|nr:D-glycero-beta-D-manno-heptose 1,7-bisphosphate 7-phosphatase [Candidatus Omnitrophota bacterium]